VKNFVVADRRVGTGGIDADGDMGDFVSLDYNVGTVEGLDADLLLDVFNRTIKCAYAADGAVHNLYLAAALNAHTVVDSEPFKAKISVGIPCRLAVADVELVAVTRAIEVHQCSQVDLV